MLFLFLGCMILLRAQDPAPPPGDPPLVTNPAPTAAEIATLDKYEDLRSKVANTAAAHVKLAQWCEQNGLRAESFFHYGKVVELDPRRDAAWLKLGFKKHDGRWMTAEQIADDEAQAKLDNEWAGKLKQWHQAIHGKKRQTDTTEPEAALAKIEDPGAVPAVYREFCGGAPTDQAIGIQVLSQINGPLASKAIATLAVYGKTPNIRRQATETLRGRPAEEFLDMLVSLMKDLIKYETRPVAGPGSPGVLFVEGERFNARRFYAPPAPPSYTPRLGDMITYDANGLPVISRSTVVASFASDKKGPLPGSTNILEFSDTENYNIGAAYQQAQRAAQNAQTQLANDVAQIESVNSVRRSFNDLVMTAAQAATGQNPGWTAQDWRSLIASQNLGTPKPPKPAPHRSKQTIDQMVPLSYAPNLAALMSRQMESRFMTVVIDH